jgi:predicted ribosome quality control (RQC) complex YloA/Tae2 family protein
MKQRMASADVAGEVSCLRQQCLGMRLANLYDLNAKVSALVRRWKRVLAAGRQLVCACVCVCKRRAP